jgi:hypothetical protein
VTAIDHTAGHVPAVAGREAGSSVYLAGRVLEAVAKKLIELGDSALTRVEGGRPVLEVDDRQSGYLGRVRLGYTQMHAPKMTPELEPDDPALVAWALASERYRDAVITKQVLTPEMVKRLKAHAVKVGEPVDAHGEVVPGLRLKPGDPTPYKHLDPKLVEELLAPERIHALAVALLSGRASLPGLVVADPFEGGSPS